MQKVGYRFNRDVSRRTILALAKGLVPDHDLNLVSPGRTMALRDNALLAQRRSSLEAVGMFVAVPEMTAASRRQHSGSKGGHGRAKPYGRGTHVNAGLSRPRRPVLVTRDDITLKTWQGLVSLLQRHDAIASASVLAPGDPVPLRPQLPARLTATLTNYGVIEYRIASR